VKLARRYRSALGAGCEILHASICDENTTASRVLRKTKQRQDGDQALFFLSSTRYIYTKKGGSVMELGR
jgi:hypothetical protein